MTNDLNITGQFNIGETTEQTGGSEGFDVINSKLEPPEVLPEEQPEEPGDGDFPENSPAGEEPDGPVPTNELEMAGYLVRHCRDCSLGWTRTNAVPGDGPMDAEIMIIAEGPGKNEDQQGLPFVGAAGKFLDELLPMAGLSRDQVFITNVIKCRAPENRDPQPEEVEACSRHLHRQIKIINPRLIIALGKFSLGSHATITTRLGGPIRAQGSWSIMGGLGKHIAILAPQFDWALVSLTLRWNDLETVAKSARKLAVNATSKKHVALIPHIQEQAVTTMNQRESGKLMNLMSVREPSDLPSKLGVATLMVTRGARGRTVYQANGERWDAPTVPVPQGADFIGAGDAATAGLVYSQPMGLDLNETVDRFITRLLQRNADAFQKP